MNLLIWSIVIDPEKNRWVCLNTGEYGGRVFPSIPVDMSKNDFFSYFRNNPSTFRVIPESKLIKKMLVKPIKEK